MIFSKINKYIDKHKIIGDKVKIDSIAIKLLLDKASNILTENKIEQDYKNIKSVQESFKNNCISECFK